jgi:hypothetical protein
VHFECRDDDISRRAPSRFAIYPPRSYRIVTISFGRPPPPATQMSASEVTQAMPKLITASALA